MNNISNIRYLVNKKKQPNVFYATENDTSAVLTDMDNFPYQRFYRGQPESPNPIVFNREAGWREVKNNCYNVEDPTTKNIKNTHAHCFETGCSVVYPCYPSFFQKYADRDAFNVSLNNACIIEYR